MIGFDRLNGDRPYDEQVLYFHKCRFSIIDEENSPHVEINISRQENTMAHANSESNTLSDVEEENSDEFVSIINQEEDIYLTEPNSDR